MKELLQAVGKRAEVSLGGLTVLVKILDVKQSYGRTRYLVTPVTGSGEVWVEQVSIK